MHVVYDLHHLNKELLRHPVVLTIGNFDGMHKGHHHLLNHVKNIADEQGGSSLVITFKNHPLHVLYPEKKLAKITPFEEKIRLLKEEGIDTAIALEFNAFVHERTYHEFLKEIKKTTSFDHLVLGEGASFGKKREGNEGNIKNLEKTLEFSAHYIPKLTQQGQVISSQTIRDLLEKGDVEKARDLLGRPFSLYAPYHIMKLQEMGPHRMRVTFDFQNHCLLPSGYYIVCLKASERESVAIAHLTTLDCKQLGKTFDLDILLKGAASPFLNDQIIIEFLKQSPPVDFEEKEKESKSTIISLWNSEEKS